MDTDAKEQEQKPQQEQTPVPEVGLLEGLDDIEFLLEEIEDKIAPLAL